MSSRWAARRLVTAFLAFVLSPVLFAILGLPAAQGSNPPKPQVSFQMAAAPLIGETVGFDVSFVNDPAAGTGYGPYVDLQLPMGFDKNDGLTFTSATYLGAPVTSVQLTADIFGCVLHPYAVQMSGAPVQVCGLDHGQSYVVLRLPFGSFTPGQPAATVHVTTQLSDLANVGVPLPIVATGGFQFGADPLADPAIDPSIQGVAATTAVTPQIMRITKTYHGPEDETATGPNYPRSYTLEITVAPGQTVTNLTVTDALPDTLQYISTQTPTTPSSTLTEPSTTVPGGTLSANFGSVLGTGGTDATLTFDFYVPRLDAGAAPVLPAATGAFTTSTDSASASGDWDPIDTLDPTITATAGPATHTLTDKSIAIQKSVAKVGPGPVAPGDTLAWTISVEVSDYFALDTVVVDDLLGDGTRFDSTFTPTLAVAGNGYSSAAAAIDSSNYTVAAVDGITGKTSMSFKLSDELQTRGQDGRMVGGCIDPVGGSAIPDCTAYNNGATTATIVFHSTVQRTYIDGTSQVVEGDTLVNHAAATGKVLDTSTFAQTGGTIGDGTAGVGVAGAGAQVTIARGSLTKTIYAVNGDTHFDTPVHVSPGNSLTYRLTQTFPTSRTDDFKIIDYLPLPVFYASGVATWDGDFTGSAPAAGHYSYGPSDTFHLNHNADAPGPDPDAPRPVATADPGSNSVEFSYGNYALYPAGPSTADILFTVTVSTDPFADGLLLTNQARSQTRNALGTLQTADAIIQITLDQPVMSITKGVVGTDNPAGILSPTDTGPVTFTAPPAPGCPGFSTGLVTTATLADHPVKSDLSGVDAGDYVRFAVVVQNTGHANAFDVQVKDEIPAGFVAPPGGLHTCVADGAGNPIGAVNISDGQPIVDGAGLFDKGIQLVNGPKGSLAAGLDVTTVNDTGSNVAVITYTLQVATSAVPESTVTNTASLLDFANSPGGKGHLAAPLTDTATVSMATPAAAKTTIGDSLANTVLPKVAVGEVVTYQLTLTIPEGTLPNATVVDNLPAGMALVDCKSISASAGVSTSLAGFATACNADIDPTVGTGGQLVTFNLGTLTNSNTDNAAAETVVIQYHAVVLNVAGNQAGTTLHNSAAFSWDGGSIASVSAADVTVVEPGLSVDKNASTPTGDAGDSITYTITVSNPSAILDPTGSDGFDVSLSDIVPTGMTYDPTSFIQTGGLAATISDAAAPTLTATWATFPQGSSATFQFSATINGDAAPATVFTNHANVAWTSMFGDVTAAQSDFNDVSTERTGNTGNRGGTLNDYTATDSAAVTVPLATIDKTMPSTNQAFTTTTNVAVGEILEYRVVLTIPEGVEPGAKLIDTLPAGLALVDCENISTSSADLHTTLAGGFGDACHAGTNPTVGVGGQLVTFDLGTVTNLNRDNLTAEKITINYHAVVLNMATNLHGASLHNSAVLSWTGGNSATAAAPNVTVLEPIMTITKTRNPVSGDAGDVITFTVTIKNPSVSNNTDAKDAVWTDPIPAGMTYVAASLACTPGGTCPVLDDSNPATLKATWATFPLGAAQAVITYRATLDTSVQPGTSITDTSKLTWTSLPGDVTTAQSTFSTVSTERTGDTLNPGGALNNYSRTASVTVSIPQPAPAKTVVTTSEAGTGTTGTGDALLAIGEVVRYRVAVTIPEGQTSNASIVDNLPPGLTYISGTTRIAFVANQGGITSDVPGLAGAVLAGGGDGSWAGDPTFVMPGAQITGGPFNDGTDPIFNLGTLTNSDSDLDTEVVVVEFNAVVGNVAGNTSSHPLTNTASIRKNGIVLATSAGLTSYVAEPAVTVTKTLQSAPTDGGDTIVYLITIANATGTYVSPAYELEVTDPLNANLTLVSAVPSVPANATDHTNYSTGAVDFVFGTIAPGDSETLTITATVVNTVDAGRQIPNIESATWTSLPGPLGTTSNPTGSATPGATGTATGERDGSGGTNSYYSTSSVSTTVAVPSISKLGPIPASAAVGAVTTFDLVVTLPEGTTRGLTVIDTLPAGLKAAGSSVIATAAGSSGRLGVDFGGTLPSPTKTSPVGSGGGTWTFAFGDTYLPPDGSSANNSFLIQVTAIVANVTGNQSGTVLSNTAVVGYTDPSSGATTIAAPFPRTVSVLEPSLQISKTANVTAPRFGGTVKYTLTLSHKVASNSDAFDVTMTDTLPAGLTYVGASLTNTAGLAPTSSSVVGSTITISFNSFPLASTSTFTYQATVGSPPGVSLKQSIVNDARATWTSTLGANPDERTGADGVGGALNDYAAAVTAPITVSGIDLSLTKDDSQATTTAGAVLTYVLTYHNTGNQSATGVTITEVVPAGTNYTGIGWVCASGGGPGKTCTRAIGTVAANATSSVNFVVTVIDPVASALTQVSNTAVIADDGTKNADPTPANNTATDVDTIAQADLSLTKTIDDPAPDAGQVVAFTLTVSNVGPSAATNVRVTDTMPGSLSYVSSTPNVGGSYDSSTGIWTVGTVASGGSESLVLRARVTAPASAVNVAEITHSDQGDPDSVPANGVTTEDDYAVAGLNPNVADLGVTKSVDLNHPNVGDDVTFTIVATNHGPNDATGVQVVDTLPAGLTYGSSNATSGSYDSVTHTWTIGSLANGASETLTLVATVANPGTITNTATISGDPFDPKLSNNSATVSTSQLVDLVVTKSVNDPAANVGTTVIFTVGVSNTGPSAAHNVVISDLLPTGLTYVSDTSSAGTSYGSTTGDWTVGTLAAEASASLTLHATVASPTPTTNTAAVLAVDEPQSSTANDSATATVTPPHSDLSITKTVAAQRPNVGDSDSFTLTVTNNGPDDATGVHVADLLPAGLTYVSHLAGQGGYDSGTGVWSIGPIASGDSVTLTINVLAAAAGDYTNTATVSGDQYDPTPGNNTASASLSTRIADIAVTKVADKPAPAVGTTVKFTITATNNGPDGATLLVIHDALPAGLTYISDAPGAGTYDSTTGDWTIGSLANGASVTLDISARVVGSGSIGNIAAVKSLLQRDPDPSNDSATATIDVPPAADLELTKTVDDPTPDLAANVTFTITVTNHGPNATAGVHVGDLLPAGLTYVSDTPSVGTYDSTSGDWTIGGMAVGASETLQITATVGAEGPITNIAEVTASSLFDPNSTPGNNAPGENDQASAVLNSRGVADLAVAKTVNPTTVHKGDKAAYTLVVTNHGPDAASGVIVRDQLPAGVTFVSSTGGAYDPHTGAWTVGNLASGSSANLTITVKIGQSGTITNTASVVASNQRDPVPGNDQATAGVAAAGPTLPPTVTNDHGSAPWDLGQLAIWLIGFASAAAAVVASGALANRNRRLKPRR